MYYTWLPEAFICCLTWQAWYLLIAMRHHLQPFPPPPSFSSSVHFQGMCQGETMRAWVLGLYKLLSWMDIYLGGHSKSIDMCGDGFLQDKERDGGRRLEKRESRYRQRKISSVNQAWLTARYFWDWWQFSTGGTPASHLHYNVKLPPPPLSSHLHAVFCEFLHPSARPELWVRSYQTQPQSAVGLMYAWSSVINNPKTFHSLLSTPHSLILYSLFWMGLLTCLTHPSPVSRSQALTGKVTKGCNLPAPECDSGTGCVRNTCEKPPGR